MEPVKPKTPTWIHVVGWVGVALIVGAYFLLSRKFIEPGMAYQAMNLIGAVGVAVPALHTRNWQSFVLQVIWSAIAISTLVGG